MRLINEIRFGRSEKYKITQHVNDLMARHIKIIKKHWNFKEKIESTVIIEQAFYNVFQLFILFFRNYILGFIILYYIFFILLF